LPTEEDSDMRRIILVVKEGVTVIFLILILSFVTVNAQVHTVGLFENDSTSFFGYTLFAPLSYTTTYLIDNYGRVVNSWESSYKPGMSCYLLENGHLLRTANVEAAGGGAGGAVEEIAWDGTLVWRFDYLSSEHLQHHDVEALPNGNILMLAWEHKTGEEALASGRRPELIQDDRLSPEHIIEVKPQGVLGGEIVWEWHLWDHLIQDYDSTRDNYGVVEEHPELVDINFIPVWIGWDWIHANAIDYNPELDQIVISCRNFSEIWIIDHSTTTEEAAGHTGGNGGMGGDILWRWGNPQAYRAGDSNDRKLYGQHDARWIEPGLWGEGNIMVFNNGLWRPDGGYSSVEEIVPPVDENGHYPQPAPGTPHGPKEPVWIYTSGRPWDFFSRYISGAHRLPDGHTMICSGNYGTFFEVTPEGETVWKYVSPVTHQGPVDQGNTIDYDLNPVFRCHRYAPDYPGLKGHDLTPGGQIEIYPISISKTVLFPSTPSAFNSVIVNTEITDQSGIVFVELYIDTGDGFLTMPMLDDGNHYDGSPDDSIYGAVIPPQPEGTCVSYYVYARNFLEESTSDPPYAPGVTYSYVVSHGEPRVIINEFMADNGNVMQDEAGDYDDWLELYNPQAETVSLEGMYLTDDYTNRTKWQIPDTVIPPGGYLLFWADAEEGEGILHTNFTLNESGELIGLFEADRHEVVPVDWVVFEAQYTGSSFGRCRDGGDDWGVFQWRDASPGHPNFMCSDATADCCMNLSDVIYLARYVLEDGDPPPHPIYRGNADGENGIDILDVIHLAKFYLKSGLAPQECENYEPRSH